MEAKLEQPVYPSLRWRVAMTGCFSVLVITFGVISRKLFSDDSTRMTPIDPASYAFSIWGFIWFLQAAGCIYSFLPVDYTGSIWKKSVVEAAGAPWAAGFLLELVWGLAELARSRATVVFAPFLLGAACACFTAAVVRLGRLGFYATRPSRQGGLRRSICLYAFYFVPSGMNAAWLAAATSICILQAPRTFGTSFDALVPAAITLATLATIFALALAIVFGELPFGLTIIWAFVAIINNQSNHQMDAAVITLGVIVAIGLACTLTLGIIAPPPPLENDAEKLRLHVVRDYVRRRFSHVTPLKFTPEVI